MSTCFSELCSASWSRYCIQSGTKNNRLSNSPWSNTPLMKIIPITLTDPNLFFYSIMKSFVSWLPQGLESYLQNYLLFRYSD